MKKIVFNDLGEQWSVIRDKCLPQVTCVLEAGNYVGGDPIDSFEVEFAEFTQSAHAVAVSNGTDALKMGFHILLGESSEHETAILCPANTFIAAVIAILSVNFYRRPTIVLFDIDDYFLMDLNGVEQWLKLHRHRFSECVLLATHLFGQPLSLSALRELKERFDLKIFEDASQAHGAMPMDGSLGVFSEMVAYSLYPGKGLGAVGDAGVITTNSELTANRLRRLRNYGSSQRYHYEELGWNHRMDTLQAVVLREKLIHLESWNEARASVAQKYIEHLGVSNTVVLPRIAPWTARHVWHIFAVLVRNRDQIMSELQALGIPTLIHYPVPLHEVPYLSSQVILASDELPNATSRSREMISLPIHPFLSDEQLEFISRSLINFAR